MVLVNLFIASILETFQNNKKEIEQEEELQSVYVWRRIWQLRNPLMPDKDNTEIPASEFFEILMRTPHPAGLVAPVTTANAAALAEAEQGKSENDTETAIERSPTSLRDFY